MIKMEECRHYTAGERVKLAIDNKIEGVVSAELPAVDGMPRYQVFHGPGNFGEYYANQLLPFEDESTNAAVQTIETFLAEYAVRKLTLPSYSSLFSLNAGKIKFIPYQFRPLKKIIQAERPRLLIADEVGVGKTIETGIIIKEFERRESIESILIVCPKELSEKWQREMRSRFDEPFAILDGSTLGYCIQEMELEGEWPIQYSKCIVGLEMIRREEMANKLIGLEDGLRFDMLVLDEAHHVVNTASNSFAILEHLAECSDIAVFLSATPIQLKSRDLFALLSLLLPEEFTDVELFNEMAEPNRYLNGAIRNIRRSISEGWQDRAVDQISKVSGASSWATARYGKNRQLAYWQNRLLESTLTDEERIACLHDLESLHSFAHVINRTKRRDIGEFTLREPVSVCIEYTQEEMEFYQASHEFALGIYTAMHGSAVARMIMATIDRLMTSCLPAFAELLDNFIERGMLAVGSLSDDIDLDIDDVELDEELTLQANKLRLLAKNLPKGDAKTNELLKIIDETVAETNDGKLLVFSFFKHTLKYLGRKVSASGVRCAILNGDTPSEERSVIRERFRLPKADPLAIDVLLSSEVGCEGLDYEFCSRMVNYDIPWNPMKIEQRIGRIDRFGQKSPKVRIYNFIVDGTIEERIFFRCFERLGVFNSTVGDLESVLGNIESDLTKIAYDLDLTDQQKAEKAQQGIDNAIRDAAEQQEFEENAKDLFLMDLAAEDEEVGGERSVQMALLQRLLVEYLSKVCPTSQFEIVNPGQIRARMYKTDKTGLLKNLFSLKRARKVNVQTAQYKQLESFLQSDAQVIILDFDGSKDQDKNEAMFVSLANPLITMALQTVKVPDASQNIALLSKGSQLPCGNYYFALCEWEQKGYRNETDIKVVVIDEVSKSSVDISLVDFEAMLLECETSSFEGAVDINILDEILYKEQTAAKKRLLEINEDIVESKIAILNKSYGTKIERAKQAAAGATSPKIRLMKTRQAENLQVIWDEKREALLARKKADILVRRFATGMIEVR